MKLNLTVKLDKDFARQVASQLGMNLEISEPTTDKKTGFPTLSHREATFKEVENFLENEMKKTITQIYSDTVAEIQLAQLDALKEQKEKAIEQVVSNAISTED